MNQFTVVAAIIKKDSLYLIVQRNKHKYLGLKWEFPGGKVESGETFKEALLREIEEELLERGDKLKLRWRVGRNTFFVDESPFVILFDWA